MNICPSSRSAYDLQEGQWRRTPARRQVPAVWLHGRLRPLPTPPRGSKLPEPRSRWAPRRQGCRAPRARFRASSACPLSLNAQRHGLIPVPCNKRGRQLKRPLVYVADGGSTSGACGVKSRDARLPSSEGLAPRPGHHNFPRPAWHASCRCNGRR